MSLRSTIRQIESRDNDAAAIAADKASFIRQWADDLNSLYGWIEQCLGGLVKEQLVSFERHMFELSEEPLGNYMAPGLEIKAASKEVYINPTARITSGGAGRADMFRTDRPSEAERVPIVRRVQEDGTTAWFIEDKSKAVIETTLSDMLPQFMRPAKSYVGIHTLTLENALDYLLRL